jgi:uncharacterized protein (DUF1501 family)
MEELLAVVENASGDVVKADEAEERVIQEIRQMGQAAQNDPLTGQHATLLGNLSDAVDTFYRDMARLGAADKVLIMTWSEFGRKVKENGNIGTDHGAAGPQFVFGNAIKQKITGDHPNLSDLNQGLDDLKFSIDFRSTYATILEKWLGVDAKEVLGGTYDIQSFI